MARVSVNGPRIKSIRLSKGLTAEALAKIAGIGTRSLLEIEEGHRQTREETLFAICKALGVEVKEVFAAPAPDPARAGETGATG